MVTGSHSRLRRLLLRALVGGLATGLLLAACGDDPEDEADIEGVEVEDGQTNGHLAGPIDYDADPPSGGDHNPVWLNCGVYNQAVPNENAVHSLEHGAVWFAYQPDLDSDQVDALVTLAETEPDRIIVSPYPDLASPVVAVAWERRLAVDDASDPRLAEFLETYVNGDQAPEPAVSCSGGVG